ncbi:hypothetical protein GCK32_011808 [Trichostrongylus colubriformis]|uniref:Uncharacterized protein n=1 Tax=Trichostrongylus colubriformis TaxID=6319 RepID=A0AAN8ENH3_TRICO
MDTPTATDSRTIQNRKGKRHRIDLNSPQIDDHLKRAIDLIVDDQSLPLHLKSAMGYLFEMKGEINDVLARNEQLLQENKLIKEKNCELLNEIASLKSQINSLKQALSEAKASSDSTSINSSLPRSCEEVERKRSVVIVGVVESTAPLSSVRVAHDIECVRRINDFLGIDCRPLCVYRMGRYVANKPRLLKVVFPSSFFASLLLRRAPKLRYFSERGIFIRASLTLAERERLKTRRSPVVSAHPTSDNHLHSQPAELNLSIVEQVSTPPHSTSANALSDATQLNM